MRDARKLVVATLVLVAAVALTACGSGDDGTTGAAEEGSTVTGEFTALPGVPTVYAEVKGEAELERVDGGTVVSISLSWLEPETQYIAHLHTGGCDQADPGGPHFQFEKGGSDQPPNELHLQFTTDNTGDGEATTSSKREVPPGEAGSIVVHLDDSHHMSSSAAGEAEAETVFVHEGVDHSKEGADHPEPEHAHPDKIACAELEGAAAAEGDSQAAGDVPTIVVRNGEPVDGILELEFDAGEEIRFRVSSDKAEEIHVHGYDLAKDVPAGGTVEFAFPAELEGIYEAELEEQGVQIAELQINP